jgi:hypothetical protein
MSMIVLIRGSFTGKIQGFIGLLGVSDRKGKAVCANGPAISSRALQLPLP